MPPYVDPLVLKSQVGVNDTYKDVPGYNKCSEDGRTGWLTMYSLARALQHELGITALSNSFGPTTMSRLEAHGPVGSSTRVNILKIVQAACFCKGYHAGDLNGEWDGVTTSGLSLSGHPTAALAMPLRTPNTPWKSDKSANGWPIGGPSSVFRIEGTNHSITLAVGSAAGVLLHAVRRFNYEIDALRDGDAKGLSTDRAVTSPERSNLLSGTAVLIRPDSFPLGTTGNLYPNEITILEDIVMEAGGVISWGGHLKIPDQGLLYIAKPPLSAATSRLAKRCDETDAMGTAGGVGQINAFERDRLREVELFLEQKVG